MPARAVNQIELENKAQSCKWFDWSLALHGSESQTAEKRDEECPAANRKIKRVISTDRLNINSHSVYKKKQLFLLQKPMF